MSTVMPSDKIAGLVVIKPNVHADERGRFVSFFDGEAYRFADRDGRPVEFVEDSLSSSRKNVLRGLHGDARTWKLLQVAFGRVFLAVADLRADSPTYRGVETFELGDADFRQVLVPAGCVNGHLCLSDSCALIYKQSQIYRGAGAQTLVAWNDPALKIPWPLTGAPILSARDRGAKPLGEA